MRIRAVIFDVYQTLLEVGPPPADPAARWEKLWHEQLNTAARLSLTEFTAACDALIAREHAVARKAGISFSEVFWPAIVADVLPELSELSFASRDEFLFRHTQIIRTVRLMPGAAEALYMLRDAGVMLGIASNAQPYTLREIEATGLSLALFNPDLCFWSFAHGFSKPDAHVFRILTARLRAAGVVTAEVLMVGDRLDNDIAPAQAQGWQTWHLDTNTAGPMSGDWRRLRMWLESGVGR